MQLQQLSLQDGMNWVKQGLGLFRRYPMILLVCGFLYLFLLIFTSLIPVLGSVLPLMLAPALSLGLTAISKSADQGQAPSLSQLFAPLKDPKSAAFKGLMVLGVVNVAGTLVALSIAGLFDDGMLMKLASGKIKPEDPSVNQASLLMPVVAFFAVYTPIQMALWFSPMFVGWHEHPAGKAMFYSYAAIWRSKTAFFGYMLAWALFALALGVLVMLLASTLGPTSIFLRYLISPVPILMFAVFFASVWFSYKSAVGVSSNDPSRKP